MATAKVSRAGAIAALKAAFPQVHRSVAFQMKDEADGLATTAQAHAPKKSGNYRQSIRVEPGKDDLTWRVVAGGPLTTKKVRAGVRDADFRAAASAAAAKGDAVHKGEFDYARQVEFKQDPVIFPLYRARKKAIKRRVGAAGRKAVKQLNLDLTRG
jgi:hypothetical protein